MTLKRKFATCLALTAVFAILLSDLPPNDGRLEASGGCVCHAQAFGHAYGYGFVAATNYVGGLMGTASSNVDCAANYCQSWAIAVGSGLCNNYNLNGGVGYVLIDWDWYYGGDPNDSGSLQQQYDCDDI